MKYSVGYIVFKAPKGAQGQNSKWPITE